jgi:hypothetical protein
MLNVLPNDQTPSTLLEENKPNQTSFQPKAIILFLLLNPNEYHRPSHAQSHALPHQGCPPFTTVRSPLEIVRLIDESANPHSSLPAPG